MEMKEDKAWFKFAQVDLFIRRDGTLSTLIVVQNKYVNDNEI